MERYRLIRKVFGGSDVFDSTGKKVAYSLPSILGDGEDFYDMDGNPLGQSFDSVFGGESFTSTDGSYGFMDEQIMMGRNLYLHGGLKNKTEAVPWEKRCQGATTNDEIGLYDFLDIDNDIHTESDFPSDY